MTLALEFTTTPNETGKGLLKINGRYYGLPLEAVKVFKQLWEAKEQAAEALVDIPADFQIKYLSACVLLGRLSNRAIGSQQLHSVQHALSDCADTFPGQFEVIATSNGGWVLEPLRDL